MVQNFVTKRWQPGIILKKDYRPRAYVVKLLLNGNVVVRNRRFLKPHAYMSEEFKDKRFDEILESVLDDNSTKQCVPQTNMSVEQKQSVAKEEKEDSDSVDTRSSCITRDSDYTFTRYGRAYDSETQLSKGLRVKTIFLKNLLAVNVILFSFVRREILWNHTCL